MKSKSTSSDWANKLAKSMGIVNARKAPPKGWINSYEFAEATGVCSSSASRRLNGSKVESQMFMVNNRWTRYYNANV